MIRLCERQHKLKKVKYLTGAKVTSFCTDQSFSPTNTFTQLCSNLTNTFSPVKYLLFRRDYNNTIILHYLAIIRRNSTRDVVALRFWSKILEINSYRGLQSSFPVTVQVCISQVTKRRKYSQLFFKVFDYKYKIQNSFSQSTYFLQNTYFNSIKPSLFN